ncbi:T9SS type A sorting domain-containing protein [Reichenbachiella versicolor]|uniref:T9SS type A sorting domain-containing protein n=1 Tax=Reichenbachiella versicolor TaxID=1821036 RepID=UPI0013A531F5|nr:T9SS type A sorting domain-containing protein [Reichenbachiella versicolor]
MRIVKRLTIVLVILLSVKKIYADQIDFDSRYGTVSGATLISKIGLAISSASVGDTIVFNSTEYDFDGKSLVITKAICISGKLADNINKSIQGAYDVETTFKNLKIMHLRSSHLTLANLKLIPITNVGYVFTRYSHITNGEFYENMKVENVIFEGGQVQAYGGDGAGITFTNCSFIQFSALGYTVNRKLKIDYAPKLVIRNCFFKPDFDKVNFNVRAISLDAGNTEYPVVWDQSETIIDNCLMDGTGLGISSKCSNVSVTNCHFKGYRADVDMIHMEEFGHSFLIDGNTFEHISPARGLFIDRELQQCHDITITNNEWIGTYAWIISSNAPYNLVFENNDFSKAKAKDPSFNTIDFMYDHGGEHEYLPYELPTRDVSVKNNIGLSSSKDGYLAYKVLNGDNSIDIEYPSSKIKKVIIDRAPRMIIDTTDKFRFRNKKTGDYIVADNDNTSLVMSTDVTSDSSDVWELEFRYPYYYFVKNTKTKKYMEVYKGYTLGDINNNSTDKILVEQIENYSDKVQKPFWYLRSHNNGKYYEILPGGNERKSRITQIDEGPELEFAWKSGVDILAQTENSNWILESLGLGEGLETNVDDELNKSVFKLFPNPSNSQLLVSIPGYTGELIVELYNTSGGLIKTVQLYKQDDEIGVTGLEALEGVYLVKVITGEAHYSTRVILN